MGPRRLRNPRDRRPSFADISRGTCYKNGILPIALEGPVLDELFAALEATPGYALAIDLEAQSVTTTKGAVHRFAIDAFHRNRLRNGLDDIALTLAKAERIRDYGKRRAGLEPRLFATAGEGRLASPFGPAIDGAFEAAALTVRLS